MNDDQNTTVNVVNRLLARALLTNGVVVPVTHWFGSDGNNCLPEKAVSCVCGDDENGWFAVDLQKFEPVKVH